MNQRHIFALYEKNIVKYLLSLHSVFEVLTTNRMKHVEMNRNIMENELNIDWSSLPFGYMPTDYNVRCYYRDGK